MLICYHPGAKGAAAGQRLVVDEVARQCAAADIPLVVETVSYPLVGQRRRSPQSAAELPWLVVETARAVAPLSIDVLEAEFPADATYEKDEGAMLEARPARLGTTAHNKNKASVSLRSAGVQQEDID